MSKKKFIIFFNILDHWYWYSRNDKKMCWALGIYIMKCYAMLIFTQSFCWNFFPYDFTKHCLFYLFSVFFSGLQQQDKLDQLSVLLFELLGYIVELLGNATNSHLKLGTRYCNKTYISMPEY